MTPRRAFSMCMLSSDLRGDALPRPDPEAAVGDGEGAPVLEAVFVCATAVVMDGAVVMWDVSAVVLDSPVGLQSTGVCRLFVSASCWFLRRLLLPVSSANVRVANKEDIYVLVYFCNCFN